MCANPSQKRIHSKEYSDLSPHHFEVVRKISKAHIDSFNFMLEEGIVKGINWIPPLELQLPDSSRLQIKIADVSLGYPMVHKDCVAKTNLVYPSECRMRGTTYRAKLNVSFIIKINNQVVEQFSDVVGDIPVMLKTKRCNLANLTPKQMVERYEDAGDQWLFLVNHGNKVANYLLNMEFQFVALEMIKSEALNLVLHYLSNGTAKLRFFYLKQPVFLPIIMVLKALRNVSDQFIYTELVKGKENDTFYCSCITNMLRLLHQEGLFTHQQVKDFIGERLRVKVDLAPWYSSSEVTDFLFQQCIAIHLYNNVDKFNLLVYMTRKLFACARGECAIENPDNPMFHELYMSGHIYFTLLLERFEAFFKSVKLQLSRSLEENNSTKKDTVNQVKKHLSSKFSEITRPMEYLISTGNLQSRTGLGLMQTAGISVMAEKINWWRFISHFRAVHRGAYFTEMKTTTCRKLYPESWGFLCPVNTPDGTPCGLLNHLSAMCMITSSQSSVRDLSATLVELGMESIDKPLTVRASECYTVILDGKVLGYVPDAIMVNFISLLRTYKATGKNGIDRLLEIGFVPKTNKPTQFAGLYLFSNPARMMRPVFNLKTQSVEIIGSFEQVYMDICVVGNEIIPNVTTHQELTETCMLSILANQIPFSDFNQSPRNMYCCQMGKQTMGTPSHTLKFRSDLKMYSISSPQSPIVRPAAHDYYHMDDYPFGTNAVVAVISYTGYDMEDALVLNKGAVERGFKHGSIHKTIIVNLHEIAGTRGGEIVYLFGRQDSADYADKLDIDGLPYIGTKVEFDDPICSYYNISTGEYRTEKYKSTEVAYISDVKALSNDSGREVLQRVAITFYIPRKPIVGDKFANRHGQKGICSVLWPQENMPFTQTGLTPDIIFNPHGFPSRMTIGMMIESMAGKSGALHGLVHDATPFMFSEDNHASDYYGKLLEAAGYNYFGTERMYSGVDGRELTADIFVGVIFYIRLRHMVGDKYQVRSVGPVDQLTRQPVQGRKRSGGIRFGEMERDSLLAHGASFLLRDRLFTQSDESLSYICTKCGLLTSLISLANAESSRYAEVNRSDVSKNLWYCRTCRSGDHVKAVSIPYVLQYLIAELASVNIKLQFEVN
ncbi:DNA-directed RNA polymerase I subunit RPA2-like protein [Dinothrombium tinctorium]|uniref:DNA-directed RNA polymerase subunit beta n=1 Tax=Dinothrombium tinctorium TaxID=1965070 RepID=A0A3S4QS96_9ACAR|nr:DNA-directed RNA polymerase I subunit RPA2-like protein [Dinothrombium tinctorium]RWS07089.1 DNA-directed RNA polymerase I subunit RPA2-like protein [Dinothrombium tinctorium]RWS08370.1 DNA-directed RNA polymerase I subunit RPA2-like protein [Dinothrombium tinctorium]